MNESFKRVGDEFKVKFPQSYIFQQVDNVV